MVMNMRIEFGYYPDIIEFTRGAISISTLPTLDESNASIQNDQNLRSNWIYPGVARTRYFGVGEADEPFSSRVFGLPKTHSIVHSSADDQFHLKFHIWALSFFVGMRLTSEETGFLDTTPIKNGMLVDFVLMGKIEQSIELAENFWLANRTDSRQANRFCAAVHALFMSQNPQHLQFERFIYLYTALDACFGVLWENQSGSKPNHAQRIMWMCEENGISTPIWASPNRNRSTEISALRNNTIHEALFVGEPLGFAIEGQGANRNLTLEMQALTCRNLAAIIGVPDNEYLQSAVNARQKYGLHLS